MPPARRRQAEVRPSPDPFLPLPRAAQRVLLLHPPVFDIRIPWAQYLQPVRLLRLSSFFRALGAEVELVDAIARSKEEQLRRLRMRTISVDGKSVYVWRYGITKHDVERQLRALRRNRWVPDIVYVECSTTFWWEGAQEIIATSKLVFPDSPVTLIGAYAELAPIHARAHTAADIIGQVNGTELQHYRPDFSSYTTLPEAIFVSLNSGRRPPEEVVVELQALQRDYDAKSFAFLDHAVTTQHHTYFRSILEAIAAAGFQQIRLSALGTLPLRDVAQHPAILQDMRDAGYQHIVFADDRDMPPTAESAQELLEIAARVKEACINAELPLRTHDVVASLSLGRPDESLLERARTATQLAHHLGSLIFWPYQPSPNALPGLPLEELNAKLFPFRSHNNANFLDYSSLVSLATVLNAKYRNKTFDFLGNSLIAKQFQSSIARRGWEPDDDVKGPLKLPARS